MKAITKHNATIAEIIIGLKSSSSFALLELIISWISPKITVFIYAPTSKPSPPKNKKYIRQITHKSSHSTFYSLFLLLVPTSAVATSVYRL